LDPVDTTTSSRGGQFEFKAVKPGNYWFTANWKEKEYKVALVSEAKNSATKCSEQGIQIDDEGTASWWITITVD
jgi:hypothetical protein